MNFNELHWFMQLAGEEAEKAYQADEVPVGAVLVDTISKEVLARGHNRKERDRDPSAHAEVLVIRECANRLKNWRLVNVSLFVTLEPCPMCLSLIQQARIERVYFGAYDYKCGSVSMGYPLARDHRSNHQVGISGGIEHYKYSKVLSQFFKEKRKIY